MTDKPLVTVTLEQYEELRESQIPHSVIEEDDVTRVVVSRNEIEQILATRYEQEDINVIGNGAYAYHTSKGKEVVVVFED